MMERDSTLDKTILELSRFCRDQGTMSQDAFTDIQRHCESKDASNNQEDRSETPEPVDSEA